MSSSLNFPISGSESGGKIPENNGKKEKEPATAKQSPIKQIAKIVETGHGDEPTVAPLSAAPIKIKKQSDFLVKQNFLMKQQKQPL